MLHVVVQLQCWLVTRDGLAGAPPPTRRAPSGPQRRWRGDAGQTTAEYALVLIGAATLAVLLITWATKTDRIGKLFDAVMNQVTGHVG